MEALIELMKQLEKADDTIWLNDTTTVFEVCWQIGKERGYEFWLEKEFPHYS